MQKKKSWAGEIQKGRTDAASKKNQISSDRSRRQKYRNRLQRGSETFPVIVKAGGGGHTWQCYIGVE